VRHALVVGVTGWFKLKRAVLDVEVVGEAFAQRVEDSASAVVRENLVVDDDVDGQHGHAGRQRPHM
jgi:hypothetical protein